MTFENRIIILVSILAALLEIVDTSIVNVAIPSMMGNLGATIDQISWVVTGYIIANAIILPMSSWLGETFGRRNYFTGCIVIFTITSALCGFAPNLLTLTIFRFIQGLAGGALLPTSQALIQEQFPPEKKGMGGAIFGMGVIVGPTLGPTLGGYLTDQYGWRSIFNINIPMGIIACLLAWTYVKDLPNQGRNADKTRSIDLMGIALLSSGIGCLQYVLERGQDDDWFSSKAICVTAAIAAFSLPYFIYWELKRAKNPILDLHLFKDSVMRNGALIMFAMGFMLYGLIFMIPVFVTARLGLSATQTGELFIPGALTTMFVMPVVGNAIRKIDPRYFILVGFLTFESCLFLLTQIGSGAGSGDLFLPLLIRGIAMGFLFVPTNTVILSQYEGRELAQVTGLTNLFRQLGGSLGIALMSTRLELNNAQNLTNIASHFSAVGQVSYEYVQATAQMIRTKMPAMIGLGSLNEAVTRMMAFRAQKEILVLSFTQLMWFLMMMSSLGLVPLGLIRLKKKIAGPISSDH